MVCLIDMDLNITTALLMSNSAILRLVLELPQWVGVGQLSHFKLNKEQSAFFDQFPIAQRHRNEAE